MKDTLLFAGAFNPPTIAHIRLAEYVMQKSGAKKVLFMPSQSYYIQNTQQKDYALSDALRLSLLSRIAENNDWMDVSDYELLLNTQPRTYETLCALKAQSRECSLLMGSDKLEELETAWLHVEEIAKEFGIVCMARKQDSCEEMINHSSFLSALKPYITIVHTPSEYLDISSSKVRNLLMKGEWESAKEYLPAEIHEAKDELMIEREIV